MAKRIAVLGGGTGTFTVLSGLKHHPVELVAVVSMADNGGSTGRLRDELGVLPPGDIRQCLVALAKGDSTLRELFNYRFSEGELSGHNFGNLFLSALQKIAGDPLKAIEEAHRILRVDGRVIPVTARSSDLYAELEDNTVVEGEHAIDQPQGKRSPIRRCFLSPSVSGNPEALQAIREADLVVIGPGDLYTSLIPVLLVDEVCEALGQSHGKVAFVMNLAAKTGQTEGYPASRYVQEMETYLSPATLDYILVNSATPARAVAARYRSSGEPLVLNDLTEDARVRACPLLAEKIMEPAAGDRLVRSLLRHDPSKLADALIRLL